MPQIVAQAIISYAGFAGAAAAAVNVGVYGAFFVGAAAMSRRQARKALQEANAQLQDVRFPVRASAEPQRIVLGRTRVGVVQLAPGWTWGEHNQNWTVPLAVAGHRIQAIEDVWFGEETIGPLDEAGYVTVGSRYWKKRDGVYTVKIAGGTAGAEVTVPLPDGVTAASVVSIGVPITEDNHGSISGTGQEGDGGIAGLIGPGVDLGSEAS